MEFADDCIISPNNCDQNQPIDPPIDPNILLNKSQMGPIQNMIELQQTLALPPSNGPCPHNSCWISAIRGLRNGLYYGGKVRFAHAIVMAILLIKFKNNKRKFFINICEYDIFGQGTPLDKLKSAIKLAWQHGKNLGSFVFVYKLVQCALQQLFGKSHPIFSFIAGIVGAFFVWRERNSVNQQICFYLNPNVPMGSAKRLQKQGLIPEFKAFGYVSMICWGVVMFLFEEDKSVLQGSLQSSMNFLYKDSDQVNGWRDFVPIY